MLNREDDYGMAQAAQAAALLPALERVELTEVRHLELRYGNRSMNPWQSIVQWMLHKRMCTFEDIHEAVRDYVSGDADEYLYGPED